MHRGYGGTLTVSASHSLERIRVVESLTILFFTTPYHILGSMASLCYFFVIYRLELGLRGPNMLDVCMNNVHPREFWSRTKFPGYLVTCGTERL